MPFRVLILMVYNILCFKFTNRKGLSLCLFGVVLLYCYYNVKAGSFDNSILMVLLSIIPVFTFNSVSKYLLFDKKLIKFLCIIALLGAAVQMLFYRYHGRPNMSYEINQSASFIFLLFLFCDVADYKTGKILTICLSVPLLSRLLFLGIALVYITKLIKKRLLRRSFHFPYLALIIGFNIALSAFSFWYSVSMIDKVEDAKDDSSRLKSVNDGSNLLRFTMNARILTGIFEGDKVIFFEGYGDLAENDDYIDQYSIQPHNELIKHISQYGLLFTLFLLLVSSNYYNKLSTTQTVEYLLPIIVYTQMLWVRFTVIPSIEMIFIFYLLTYKMYRSS